MTETFSLYSSDGCHLCEMAYELCQQLNITEYVTVVDIVDSEKLVQLYGVHIPVLERKSDSTKLFWPFTAAQIAELI